MTRKPLRAAGSSSRASSSRASSRRALVVPALAVLGLLGGSVGLRAILTGGGRPAIGGPYDLVGADGRMVSQADFRGRDTLIYFGYSHCIDVCPLTLATVSRALDELGPAGQRVVPVFITVDPLRDTPAVVRDYVARFSPRIVGLTGSVAQIDAVVRRFHVTAYRREASAGGGMQMGAGHDYLMDHSSVLYLMDGNNRLIDAFPVDSGPERIAAELRRVLPGG